MSVAIHPDLDGFAHSHALQGLSARGLRAIADGREGYSIETARRFLAFQTRIDAELLRHSIITDNPYTAWFELGQESHQQITDFIVQFSVFSNQFLVAQLQKTLNADTLEGMRASKEELEELYFDRGVDEDAFIETGNEMLGGVTAFWNGLDEQRRRIASI